MGSDHKTELARLEQVAREASICSHAIAALYQLRYLTRNERKRVLAQMIKMNDV